jgi:hypothetical protein
MEYWKMRKIILLTALFCQTICSAQIRTETESIMHAIESIKGFDEYSQRNFVISPKGEMFYVYEAGNDPDVPLALTHQSLFLTKFDSTGNIIFDRKNIYDQFSRHSVCFGCYINDSNLIVLICNTFGGGMIINYNLYKDNLQILKLDDYTFSPESGVFDEKGNFHILSNIRCKYIKLVKEESGYKIDVNKVIPQEKTQSLSVKFGADEEYGVHMRPIPIVYKNKFINIYYIDTYVKGASKMHIGGDASINYYNKVGFHILNLNNYTFEDLKIYDIDKIACEKVEDVEFPRIKIYQPNPNEMPQILMGGKSDGKDYLYKIILDENMVPVRPSLQKSIGSLKPVKTESFPKHLIWYFTVEPSDNYNNNLKKDLFLGYDPEGDNYYYFRKDRNIGGEGAGN